MALSSATHTQAHTSSPTHTHLSKLDQTTLEGLYRQGYQLDELILRSENCVKCDPMSSCPGMLYTTTEKIYFISNSNTHDIGEFCRDFILRMQNVKSLFLTGECPRVFEVRKMVEKWQLCDKFGRISR